MSVEKLSQFTGHAPMVKRIADVLSPKRRRWYRADSGRWRRTRRVPPLETENAARVNACDASSNQSGRRDLNPRPPEPHSGALPDCATSRDYKSKRRNLAG